MRTAVALGDWVKPGFEQDVEIWKNKAWTDNPLLCEEVGLGLLLGGPSVEGWGVISERVAARGWVWGCRADGVDPW